MFMHPVNAADAGQPRARRMVHDADESTIFIVRMAGASRREGRRERRGMPKVRRMKAVRQ
jgi:hypothetical protein